MQEVQSLGFLVKTLLEVEKLRVSVQIRNIHLKKEGKGDRVCEDLEGMLRQVENFIEDKISLKIETHPAEPWFSKVKGIGRENIAKVVGLIDIKEARYISSLWKYAGLHTVNGKAPKPRRGQKVEYNPTMRAVCWRLGQSLIRARGKFYEYYQNEKTKYKMKYLNQGYKVVPSSDLPKDKRGRKYEPEGVISIGHIDNMAKRKMIKLFLGLLWLVWREAEGLPLSRPYALDKLGHNRLFDPWEFVDK